MTVMSQDIDQNFSAFLVPKYSLTGALYSIYLCESGCNRRL